MLYSWTDEDGETQTLTAAFATHNAAKADVLDFYMGTGAWAGG